MDIRERFSICKIFKSHGLINAIILIMEIETILIQC